jgi:hypothetical protein
MIRTATLSDLWAMRRKPRSSILFLNDRLLTRPHRPLSLAARGALGGNTRDGATVVLHEHGQRAVAQSLRRGSRPEHDLALLAVYGSRRAAGTDVDAWFRVLEGLCVAVGQAHIQRLYAALARRHDDLREIFRQLGFVAYTEQTVLRLQGPDWDQGTRLAPMRPQSRRDVWAIHKLYGATTPRPVQQAEARDSRAWSLPRASPRRQELRGWVLGPDDDLSAYLSMRSGPSAHVMTLLLRPEERDILADVLRFGLGQINDDRPVLLVLRDYQRELLLPAEDLGFEAIGEQTLLCKQTTMAARRPLLVPGLELRPEPTTPIPTISSISEDARPYGRPTRYHQQH